LLGTRDFTQNFSLQAVVVIYAYIEWGTWNLSDLTCKGVETIIDADVILLEKFDSIVACNVSTAFILSLNSGFNYVRYAWQKPSCDATENSWNWYVKFLLLSNTNFILMFLLSCFIQLHFSMKLHECDNRALLNMNLWNDEITVKCYMK
jgi:hypothetical protein